MVECGISNMRLAHQNYINSSPKHNQKGKVSGNMTAFIIPYFIVTSPVVLFVCTQSSTKLYIVVLVGGWVGIFLGSGIVVTWLDMKLFPFRRLVLVLYICTSETL